MSESQLTPQDKKLAIPLNDEHLSEIYQASHQMESLSVVTPNALNQLILEAAQTAPHIASQKQPEQAQTGKPAVSESLGSMTMLPIKKPSKELFLLFSKLLISGKPGWQVYSAGLVSLILAFVGTHWWLGHKPVAASVVAVSNISSASSTPPLAQRSQANIPAPAETVVPRSAQLKNRESAKSDYHSELPHRHDGAEKNYAESTASSAKTLSSSPSEAVLSSSARQSHIPTLQSNARRLTEPESVVQCIESMQRLTLSQADDKIKLDWAKRCRQHFPNALWPTDWPANP
jgi:hypothetical protein